jgi:hypothetical protein
MSGRVFIDTIESVRVKFPKASAALFNCPICNELAVHFDYPNIHPWSSRLVCRCGRDWLLCTKCTTQRKHLVSNAQIGRHAKRCKDLDDGEAGVDEKKRKVADASQKKKGKRKVDGGLLLDGENVESVDVDLSLLFGDAPVNGYEQLESMNMSGSDEDNSKVTGGINSSSLNELTLIRKRCVDVGVHCPGLIALPNWERICKAYPKFVYFEKENRGKDLGKEYLVLRSCFQSSFIPDSKHLHPEDTRLYLKIAQLVDLSTRNMREILGEILHLTLKTSKRVNDGSYTSLPVPRSGAELRRQFVQNKHSLLNIIPHPTVHFIASEGIAISKFQDCLADFLAQGTPFQALTRSTMNKKLLLYFERNPTAPIQMELGMRHADAGAASNREDDDDWRSAYECSDVGDSILSQSLYFRLVNEYEGVSTPTLFLCVDVWFDDCDPNNQSKNNRGSVFLRTITFSPSCQMRNNLRNTYPYAVGPKACSRSAVDKRFQEEVSFINGFDENGERRRFFCKALGTDVAVTVKLLTKSADQPERRSSLGVTLGNANNHARFGLIVDLNQLKDVVVPCKDCQAKLYLGDRDWDKTRCDKCTQWDMEGDHPLLSCKIPKEYPSSELTDEERQSECLRPRRLELETLRLAAGKAGDRLVDGTWSEKGARAYLKSFGINDKWADAVVRFSMVKMSLYGESYNVALLDEMTENEIEEAEAMLESGNGGVPIPNSWRDDIHFFQNLDAPMHLLFLGVIKTTLELIFQWCKQNLMFANLLRDAEGILEEIQNLRISWCKAFPLGNGAFGAWVSEQWVAFGKVIIWWFGILDDVEKEPYGDPQGQHTEWNMKQCHAWLKARRLHVGGNAKEVKGRVADCFKRNGGPPPIADGGFAGKAEVKSLVRSLYAVLSLAMTETVTQQHLGNLKFAVKRFMMDFEILDSSVRPKREKPRWVTTFNIAGLQNIIGTMWWLGPLRNFWEGGFKGEGFLKFMKQEITMGLRLNWQVNVLRRMYRTMAMAKLLDEEELKQWSTDDDDEDQANGGFQVEYSDFKCYVELDLVEVKWDRASVLSAVVLEDETFRVVLQNRERWYSLDLNTDGPTIEDNGMTYSCYSLTGPHEADMALVTHACMFLPHLPSKLAHLGPGTTPFTIVRSDWKIWNGVDFGDIQL